MDLFFSTTVVESATDSRPSETGQSVLEFLVMMPMLLGLVVILVRVNEAIQTSIVNQQYARAQTLQLAFNSPFYPEQAKKQRMIAKATHQLIVGVSENQALSLEISPKAATQRITRTRNAPGASDAAGEEPPLRAKVRIRTTVTLCTGHLFLETAGAPRPILAQASSPPFPAIQSYALTQNNKPRNFCGSPFKYE